MGNVIGLVQDSRGHQIGKALVFVESASIALPEMPIWTNCQGQFQLNLPAGHYRISARTIDGGYGVTEFEKGQDNINIIIRINLTEGT